MSVKAALRAQMQAVRAALPAQQRGSEARAIQDTLLAWPGLEDPIFCFLSVRDELDTRSLIAALLAAGRTVAVPRVTGRGTMEAAGLSALDDLVPGRFGIPTSPHSVVVCRLALLPGLAFDPTGGRLGYGGGYYDRWIEAHPDVVTVGLALQAQIVASVPMEPWDRPLDRVLTASGWVRS